MFSGVQGLRSQKCRMISLPPSRPLLHFDATLSVFSPRLPPLYRCPTSTAVHLPKAPRVSSLPLSISRSKNPSFHPLGRLKNSARSSEGSYLGFGYPFYDLVQSLNPWKPLSAPYTLGLLPSELSSPPVIEQPFSRCSLRSCVFSQNPHGLGPTLQRLPPTGGAVSLLASQMFSPGQNLGSLGPSQRPRLSLHSNESRNRLPSQISLSLFASEKSYLLSESEP